MPFTPSNTPLPYNPSSPTVLGGEKERLERELRKIATVVQRLTDSVKEIQDHLDTL